MPDEFMGDVMGQITGKRGHVLGMDSEGGSQRLRAQVPQAEMFHYATELRSITQGRGRFSWKLDHYAEVPHTIELFDGTHSGVAWRYPGDIRELVLALT